MLIAVYEGKFKKDIKLAKKRGYPMQKLSDILALLIQEAPLLPKNRNHPLKGNYTGYLECHIRPDWLLIYKKTKTHIYSPSLKSTGFNP